MVIQGEDYFAWLEPGAINKPATALKKFSIHEFPTNFDKFLVDIRSEFTDNSWSFSEIKFNIELDNFQSGETKLNLVQVCLQIERFLILQQKLDQISGNETLRIYRDSGAGAVNRLFSDLDPLAFFDEAVFLEVMEATEGWTKIGIQSLPEVTSELLTLILKDVEIELKEDDEEIFYKEFWEFMQGYIPLSPFDITSKFVFVLFKWFSRGDDYMIEIVDPLGPDYRPEPYDGDTTEEEKEEEDQWRVV